MQFSVDKEMAIIKEEIVEYIIKKIENKLFSSTNNSITNVEKDTGAILSFHYPQSILKQNNNVVEIKKQRKYYIINFYFENTNDKISVSSILFRYQNTKKYATVMFETKGVKDLGLLFKAMEKEIVKIQLNNLY